MGGAEVEMGFGFGFGFGNGDSNHGLGSKGTDLYYHNMIEANPGNSLFLGNYAKFLKEVLQHAVQGKENPSLGETKAKPRRSSKGYNATRDDHFHCIQASLGENEEESQERAAKKMLVHLMKKHAVRIYDVNLAKRDNLDRALAFCKLKDKGYNDMEMGLLLLRKGYVMPGEKIYPGNNCVKMWLVSYCIKVVFDLWNSVVEMFLYATSWWLMTAINIHSLYLLGGT